MIDGLFTLPVPETYETVGRGLVFLLATVAVAHWGSVDEPAFEELHERIVEVQEQQRGEESS